MIEQERIERHKEVKRAWYKRNEDRIKNKYRSSECNTRTRCYTDARYICIGTLSLEKMENKSIMRKAASLLLNKNKYAVAYWEALQGRAAGKVKDVWVKIARLELYNYMHVW